MKDRLCSCSFKQLTRQLCSTVIAEVCARMLVHMCVCVWVRALCVCVCVCVFLSVCTYVYVCV